jgi:hypothetical protein
MGTSASLYACAVAAADDEWHLKKKEKQIGINHTQEGIFHGSQPAGQVEGEQ